MAAAGLPRVQEAAGDAVPAPPSQRAAELLCESNRSSPMLRMSLKEATGPPRARTLCKSNQNSSSSACLQEYRQRQRWRKTQLTGPSKISGPCGPAPEVGVLGALQGLEPPHRLACCVALSQLLGGGRRLS